MRRGAGVTMRIGQCATQIDNLAWALRARGAPTPAEYLAVAAATAEARDTARRLAQEATLARVRENNRAAWRRRREARRG